VFWEAGFAGPAPCGDEFGLGVASIRWCASARTPIQEAAATPETEPGAELNEGFSEPGAAARPWTEVAGVLPETEMFWLSTVRRGGRPHVTPLPAIWLDGTLHFCAGSHEQKAKNL
jgi:Pyridoxamine 5'-phosphate oxidase